MNSSSKTEIRSRLPLETNVFQNRQAKNWREEVIKTVLLFCALISVLTTFALVFILAQETGVFFKDVSVLDFLFGTQWTPLL